MDGIHHGGEEGLHSYTVTGPDGNVEVVDNFSLADSVIDTTLSGESLVAQLIKRDPSGQL